MGPAAASECLVDSDVLIDAYRQHPPVLVFLEQLAGDSWVRTSVVSALELLRGARNNQELAKVVEFLRTVGLVPLDEAVSKAALELMAEFRLSHGLMIPDALIAATALVRGWTLLTHNLKHFQMVPGLKVASPY